MKKIIGFAICALVAVSFAANQDDHGSGTVIPDQGTALAGGNTVTEESNPQTSTVMTGWTIEKAQLISEWVEMASVERQNATKAILQEWAGLESRLPADKYSAEDSKYVGYRARLAEACAAFKSNPNADNYSEFASILKEADYYLSYIERERTLPRNPPDVQQNDNNTNLLNYKDEGQILQGTGWYLGYVNGNYSDDVNPCVAALGDTVFVSCNDQSYETLYVYRSVDRGESWSLWYTTTSGSPYQRYAFDLTIDIANHYLFLAYTYVTGSISGDIWVRRFTDFNNSGTSTIHNIEQTTDGCWQPHITIEHEYTDHRICCMYYNNTATAMVIAQSTDNGQTWATVHTTTWDPYVWPTPKAAQGAASASTDRNYFVARKTANTITIFESVSGMAGSFIETDYVHSYAVDGFDVSASHNYNDMSAAVSFGYQWTGTDYNIRVLFRPSQTQPFISQLIDGDGLMTKSPVISCDAEYALNHAGPDFYHLGYYKDLNADTYYYPYGWRCLNDSASLDGWSNNSGYLESINGLPVDSIASIYDFGTPMGFYQIDMTTLYETGAGQWSPGIAWIRYYSDTDADCRLSKPDPVYGVAEYGSSKLNNRLVLQPNPAQSSILLKYSIANAGSATIVIYDAAGQVMEKLETENRGIGTYADRFEINLPNGVYFVRVITPDGVMGKSLVVVK
ncbi:MAG TPA: T9SS type A sorting domain-containing protein [bacterium]